MEGEKDRWREERIDGRRGGKIGLEEGRLRGGVMMGIGN